MATQPVIKHNSLTGRNDKDAHTIDSITDLKSSLAVLKSDATVIAGYCEETTNARDISISHASIAVAEAAQTAAQVRKFSHITEELVRTEEHVNELVGDLEEYTATLGETVDAVHVERLAAEAAAAAAALSRHGVDAVAAQLDTVTSMANNVREQVQYVTSAKDKVEEVVTEVATNLAVAQSIQEHINDKALQVEGLTENAAKSAELAETSANTAILEASKAFHQSENATRQANMAKAYCDEVARKHAEVEDATSRAAESAEIAVSAESSVGRYAQEVRERHESILEANTEAQRYMTEAQQAAVVASTSKDEAACKATESRQSADISEAAAARAVAAVEDIIRFRGSVDNEDALPAEPERCDVYQVGDKYMLWTGTYWQPIGGRITGGSIAFDAAIVSEAYLENLCNTIEDGVFVSVLRLS